MNALLRTALLAATAAILPIAANAAWDKRNVVDSLDGVSGVSALVRGTAEVSRGRDSTGTLLVKCEKNSTTVVMTHDGFAPFFARPVVRYKIDDKPVKEAGQLDVSMNHHYFGWWHGNGIAFAKSLYGAKALKVEVIDHLNGEKTVLTFNIEGTQDSLAEVAAACKWGK